MRIEEVEAFLYRGKVFLDRHKAEDYAEELVFEFQKPVLLERGFTVSEVVRITEAVLDKRETLSELLDF